MTEEKMKRLFREIFHMLKSSEYSDDLNTILFEVGSNRKELDEALVYLSWTGEEDRMGQ